MPALEEPLVQPRFFDREDLWRLGESEDPSARTVVSYHGCSRVLAVKFHCMLQ